MKKLLALLVFCLLPSATWGQCSGAFPNQTVCGNVSGATSFPRSVPLSTVVAGSVSIKTPVNLATTANITLSGDQTIDGTTLSSLPCWAGGTCRVLVWSQSDTTQNGIYNPAASSWTRATDFNTFGQVVQGTEVWVNGGVINSRRIFFVTSADPITPGTSAIVFSTITGPAVYGIRVVTTAGTVTVAALETAIALNKGTPSATTIQLPAVNTRNGLILYLYDWAGTGGPITIQPAGAETIMGLSSWTVTSGGVAGSGGSFVLIPSVDLSGWLAR